MRLYLATPAYHDFAPQAALSFVSLAAALEREQIRWTWDIEAGDSNHARAWNLLFHRFLQSDAQWLIGLDTDQTFTPQNVLDLVNAGEDYVMAAIEKRNGSGVIVGHPLENGERRGPLAELYRTGFGVFAATRRCIEMLSASRLAVGAVFSVDQGHANEGQLVAECVNQGLGDGRWLAADDVFSDRWRALGGKLWIHTGVRCGHIGTKVYGGES